MQTLIDISLSRCVSYPWM